MKNGNHKDLKRSIVLLSLFVLGLVISVHYSYPSITAIALGVPSSTSTTAAPTTNTALNQITLLNNKGTSLYNSGRFNESIAYFDKALVIDPKNIAALFHKGNALAGLGNYTQAITYYDKPASG